MKTFTELVEKALPSKKIDIFGRGGLLMTSKPYYILFGILLLGCQIVFTDAWALMAIIYALLPFLDELFTLDTLNPTEAQRKELQGNDIYFRVCLYLTMIADWALFFRVMSYVSTFELTLASGYNLVGLFFIFSNVNAVQFAVAHQIFHKASKFDRFLGTIHMSKILYMHFTYEHLYGHHRRVATPEDPASSRQGENLYQFLPRTFLGSYKSVYKMQKQEEGKPFYLNYAVLSVVEAFVFTSLILYFYNVRTGIFFMLEAFFSIVYLEAINFIEHYGLSRKKLPNGQYQKVSIRHSWNAPHRISNYILFKLQRHSDHHENSLKPYQTLVSLNESPHLPHGYSLMIFASFFPGVWSSIMDPLVQEYKKVGAGNVQNEVTEKAKAKTRQFMFQLGGTMLALWVVGMLLR